MSDDFGGEYMAAREQESSLGAVERARQRQQNRATQAAPATTPAPAAAADDGGFLDTSLDVMGDVGLGILELPKQAIGGVRDAAQETLEGVGSLASMLESKVPLGTIEIGGEQIVTFGEGPGGTAELPEVGEARTVTGDMGRNVAQFLTGFLPAMKATKGLAALSKAAKVTRPLIAGAVADATVFDPHEERLADLIESVPALQNPVTEFLAADPTDSEAMGRFKNALEGSGLGVASDAFAAAVRGIRGARVARAAARGRSAADAAADAAPRFENQPVQVRRSEAEPVAVVPRAKGEVDEAILERLSHTDDLVVVDDAGVATIPVSQRRSININLDRLDTLDDTQRAIDETAKLMRPQIDEATRGVQTNEATLALSNHLGLTPEQLLQRRRGQAYNAEEALAARRLLVASGDNVVKLARAASDPNAGDATLFQFRRAVALHGGLQEQVSGLTAEAGRSLQAFRIPAGTSQSRVRAIKEFLDTAGGKDVTQDLASKMANLDTPEAIAAFARGAKEATTKDMIYEAWINGLLSSPQTHAVNVLSNAIVAMWQVPERFLASGVRQAVGGTGVEVGEATALAFGMVHGIRDGARAAARTFRSGVPEDPLTKLEVVKHQALTGANLARTKPGRAINALTRGSLENGGLAARAVDYMGEAIRLPGRFLLTEDAFFRTVGQRMEIQARAWRMGTSEGLQGRALAARVTEIVADPPEDIVNAAFDVGRYQTFTKPLGEGGRFLQAGATRVPGLRVIVPFIRTPVNILKFVGERTPLAPLSQSIRADVAAGGARADLALARLSMGTMIMALAGEMTASGQITGGGPTNRQLRAARRRTGWQPYSLKVGDTYHAFNRLDPVGATLGIAADIAEIMGQVDGADADTLAGAGVMAVANNIVSKTYMQGIADVIEIFASVSPELGASRGELWLTRMAGTVIPSGVAQIERVMDPQLRRVDGVVQQIKSRTPGFSDELLPVRNLWGEPIDLQGGLGPDIVSPVYTSLSVPSPVDEEIIRLQVPIGNAPRNMDGVELKPEEHDLYVRLAGNELKDQATGMGAKETLDALVGGTHPMSGAYLLATEGPQGGKATAIRQIINGFRAAAREQVKAAFPVLQEAIVLNKINQRTQQAGQ